ncbi:MAG: ATP-binding protein [Bacteroidales bacterium]|nr:ATP-binding protein [Bacteroidales bacterium]
MFRRDIILDLQHWANRKNRKPLVLRGARQVGKTSVVQAFGNEFENYIYVNLEENLSKKIFDEALNVRLLLDTLFSLQAMPRKVGRTLLFIDEIQNSPRAVQLLRYFYEQMPEIYVIAAGSLLETLIDRHISFPVGRVEYMAVHPCSFREFLTAKGDDAVRNLIMQNPEMSISLHLKLMSDFQIYSLIGGMPEVVNNYLENSDLVALSPIYTSLLTGYMDDVEKYASKGTETNVIRTILSKGWTNAGQQITFNNFAASNYKSREMGEGFRTLERAMLLELAYPVTSANLPLVGNQRRMPKLLWLDCGLVSASAKVKQEILRADNLQDVWRGAYAEQIVGQELLTLNNDVNGRRHFWMREDTHASAEVDYVYQYEDIFIPIEVKLGSNAHLRSLHRCVEEGNLSFAVRVWSEPLSVNDVTTIVGKKAFRLLNVPFYMVGMLDMLIKKYI